MTLEEVRHELARSENKLQELRDQRQNYVEQLKEVIREDAFRRRELGGGASQMGHAAAACGHAKVNQRTAEVEREAGRGQPFHFGRKTTMPNSTTNPKSGTSASSRLELAE
ncbi:hypothetical protein MRX96_009653 [Rhipicephalus microplus]